MYNFYNTLILEKKNSWRSASEIQLAALAHEKRRIQRMDEGFGLAKAQETRQSSWSTLVKAPLRLFAALIG